MSKKTVLVIFIFLASPLIVYFLLPSDEAKIKKLIKKGAAAVEAGNLEGVMSLVSFGYRDDYGQSYMVLKENAKNFFNSYSDIEVEYENPAVEVRKDKASASFDLRMIASEGPQRGYVMGDLKKPLRLSLELEKSPTGKWLATKGSGMDEYAGGR